MRLQIVQWLGPFLQGENLGSNLWQQENSCSTPQTLKTRVNFVAAGNFMLYSTDGENSGQFCGNKKIPALYTEKYRVNFVAKGKFML